MSTPIDTSTLIYGGNMTGGDNLAGIFDGNSATQGYNQSTTGWAWVQLASPIAIDHVDFISPSLGYDASGLTSAITLNLYGKTGSVAPTSPTDGVLLSTNSFTDVNAVTTTTLISKDKTTLFTFIWANDVTGVWTTLEDLKIYPVVSIPTLAPQPSSSAIFSFNTHQDVDFPLPMTLTEIPGFRKEICMETTGVITLECQFDSRHESISGYTGPVEVSGELWYRYAVNYADLATAPLTLIPHAVSGGNIESLTDHYITTNLKAEMTLAMGFYQFCVLGISATTANNFNGNANVHTETGAGLNYFIGTVNKNEIIIT